MSSKTVHSLAGLAVGLAISQLTDLGLVQSSCVLLGTHFGASAPDWLEVPVWVTRRHWFRRDESQRHSLIPHRTITHTLSLWIVAIAYCGFELYQLPQDYVRLLAFGFCASGLSHLLLDISTPMGIPLWPFGVRYRRRGIRLAVAPKPFNQR